MQVAPRFVVSAARTERASYVRNLIFGVEDGLVSTVGLLAGVATADVARADIILTGVVLIVVEAFSMATGSFLSESEAEEYERGSAGVRRPIIDGLIMFASYGVAGLIPLLPYVFIEIPLALFVSIGLSLVSLTLLGALGARFSRSRILPHALKMLVVGGVSVGVGVLVARLLRIG